MALAGCVIYEAPVVPPQGVIFTNVRAPLTTHFGATPTQGRVGKASTAYLWEPFFGTSYAWDKADVETAMRKAGLTKVYYADHRFFSILGLFGMFTVVVHGE
jgi:hypothetical protein